MAQPTLWQRTKKTSKSGFDKVWGYADKLGQPVNRLSNKIGSESFWPTTIDKESNKAARILRSFCKDGFYEDEVTQTAEGPKAKQRVLKKIPAEVIKNAKGLAIFTTMRTGLWFSGAGGSGIVIARLEDGSWSCPSGILLHTAALGFLVGVDIYDCVLVLNTTQAVEAFSKWRCTLGTEVSAVAGPVGVGGILDTEVHKRRAAIFTYLKSRGFYAGVQVDGTVIVERGDENEKFYHERLPASDILAGKVRHPPVELRTLFETLKAAQGDTNVDSKFLTDEPPPADFEVVESGQVFGVPDKGDPDPYGVIALEKQGYHIKKAGTELDVPPGEFEFSPKITSPVYETFNRRSMDDSASNLSVRSSWRNSSATTTYTERRYTTTDVSTQTDFDSDTLSISSSTRPRQMSEHGSPVRRHYSPKLSSGNGLTPIKSVGEPPEVPEVKESENTETLSNPTNAHDDKNEDDEHDEYEEGGMGEVHEVKVHKVTQVQAPQIITKAKLVNVPKRIPPQLPPRNPGRGRASQHLTISPDASTATEAEVTSPVSVSPSKDGSIISNPSEQQESNTSRDISPVKPPTLPPRTAESPAIKMYDNEHDDDERPDKDVSTHPTLNQTASRNGIDQENLKIPATKDNQSNKLSLADLRSGLDSDDDYDEDAHSFRSLSPERHTNTTESHFVSEKI